MSARSRQSTHASCRAAAEKAAIEADEAEYKRQREAQRQSDEATRLKAANWEQSAEVAAEKMEEKRAKGAERRQAKIAKVQVPYFFL